MNNETNFIQMDFMSDFIAGDAPKVGKYRFPQLERVNILPDAEVLPFNYFLKTERHNYWYHCFVDDGQFMRIYRNPWYYVDLLRQARGLIATDFSMYRNDSEAVWVENCRRNRSVAYALQKASVPFIPTAGFAGESSWDWCFDGLPKHFTVAVTTNCLGRDPEAERLFVGGVNAMIGKIQPSAIVVCGRCPDWIARKYPSINVVQIPNYSQMWQMRRRGA